MPCMSLYSLDIIILDCNNRSLLCNFIKFVVTVNRIFVVLYMAICVMQ